MSFNQSMSDKNETKYRKTGRSTSSNQQHRGFSPSYQTGAGAGSGGPTPSISFNRSFKKSNNNAQGGQSRANVTNLNPSDAGPSETSTTVAVTASKQTEPSVPQRSSQAVPKAPASQSVFVTKEQAKQWKLKAILDTQITSENIGSGGDSLTVSGSKDKPLPELRASDTSTTVAITAPKQTEPSVPQRSSQAVPKAPTFQSAFVTKEQAKQWKLKAILNRQITPENLGSGGDSLTVSGSKDKPLPELSRTKSTTSKGKKKRKEILSKATAAMVKSDLCGPYKNPEGKKDIASSESVESTSSSIMSKQEAAGSTQQVAIVRDEGAPSKAEPDDWEDADDISTLKLGTSDGVEQACGDKKGSGHGAKKYSRDFLLKFSMQYHPETFEIMSEIAETLNANVNASPSVNHKPLPELSRTMSTTSNGKKKRKEILSKSAAAKVKSDLYEAYKNREDKKDIASSESVGRTSTSIMSKQEAADSTQQVAIVRDEGTPSKAEPDDWEDATDSSTPKLGTSNSGEQACGDKDGCGHRAKKYSRDFLLKFSMQFLDVPEGFEIMSDIAEFLNANVNASPSVNYKPLPELSRTKSITAKGKKKRKETLSTSAAATVNSDLYGAYKNPEDKKDVASSEIVESTSTSIMSKQEAANSTQQVAIVKDEGTPCKAEPDDWEDAADISTPKLGPSDIGEQACGDKDGSGHGAKKYSRDFLLKFSMHFLDLPEGFAIMSGIMSGIATFLNANVNASPSVDYKPLPELIRTKNATSKGKKKRKEILSKSAAAMVKSDLSSTSEGNVNFGSRDPSSTDRTPPPAQGASKCSFRKV